MKDEAAFLSAVNLLAEKYGGTANINFDTFEIDFDVNEEYEEALAFELAEMFSEYLV